MLHANNAMKQNFQNEIWIGDFGMTQNHIQMKHHCINHIADNSIDVALQCRNVFSYPNSQM
jgi:hypothetical protein